MRQRLVRIAPAQAGYTLVELLGAMLILGIILGGVTTGFISSSRAELDLNRRFQAQLNARLGMERLRRDVHCATTSTAASNSPSVTLNLPSGCTSSSGPVTWCTQGSTGRYKLIRSTGSACTVSLGVEVADYLTLATPFTYTKASGELGKLRVDLRVDLTPNDTAQVYELVDELVLRNGTR